MVGEQLHDPHAAGRRPSHHPLGERTHELLLAATGSNERLPRPQEPALQPVAVGVAQPQALDRQIFRLVPSADGEVLEAQSHHGAYGRVDGSARPAVLDDTPQRRAAVIDPADVEGGDGDLHDLRQVHLLPQRTDSAIELGQGRRIQASRITWTCTRRWSISGSLERKSSIVDNSGGHSSARSAHEQRDKRL